MCWGSRDAHFILTGVQWSGWTAFANNCTAVALSHVACARLGLTRLGLDHGTVTFSSQNSQPALLCRRPLRPPLCARSTSLHAQWLRRCRYRSSAPSRHSLPSVYAASQSHPQPQPHYSPQQTQRPPPQFKIRRSRCRRNEGVLIFRNANTKIWLIRVHKCLV